MRWEGNRESSNVEARRAGAAPDVHGDAQNIELGSITQDDGGVLGMNGSRMPLPLPADHGACGSKGGFAARHLIVSENRAQLFAAQEIVVADPLQRGQQNANVARHADAGGLRDVLGRAVRLAAFGIIGGAMLAALAAQGLSTLLLGVSPFDPLTYVVVSMFLVGVCLFASFIPARRATRVDPIVALRAE